MMTKPNTQVCSDGKVRGKRPAFPEAPCMTPGCLRKFGGDQEKKGARGLCWLCHANAMSLIKQRKTTWEELEDVGLCQPPYRSLKEKALIEKKKEQDKHKEPPLNMDKESSPTTDKDQ